MTGSPNTPRLRMTPVAAAICGGLITLVALPTHAQTASQGTTAQLAPVTVTATGERATSSPKATAAATDTPQTVQIIPSEVFNDQGARNLTDVLRNTPGISFDAGENGFGTNTNDFSLRGFSTTGNIFVDGARDSGNYARDAFNLEQVEVIKGPAADNGRGSAGGYINLQTKTARSENFVRGSVGFGFDEYDSEHRLRTTLDVNRQLNETSAFRINLLAEDSGIPGREHAKQKSFGIAPTITFGLNSPTTVTLSAQHLRQKDRPDWGVPAATIRGTLRYDPAAKGAKRDTFYGLKGDSDKVTSNALMARIEHRISPSLSISNQTRWSKTARDAFVTAPTGSFDPVAMTVTTQRWGFTRENTTISNLTNISSQFDTGSLKHNLAVGLELTREESDSGRHPTINAGNVNIFNPDPNRLPGGSIAKTQTGNVKIDTAALYAYDTIEFSPRWQATGGLRVEQYRVKLSARDLGGAAQPQDGYKRTETTVGGKLGVVYKPAPNGSIYASYGLSSVPPGSWLSNPDSGRTGNNAFPGWDGQNHSGAKEQKLINYEIGTKWELFDRRLSATAALFRTERRNVAMRAAAGTDYPSGYGKQIVQGLELGLAGNITPAWDVYGGVTFLDSERRHGAAVDASLSRDYAAGYTTTNGDELAFTPELTVNLWTSYRLPSGITIGGGVQHSSSTYVGRPDTADRVIPNGQSGKVPSYTIYNLMAAYEVSQNLRLRLNIDNVTDEKYITSMNWSAQRAFLGAPRTVLLSADISF